MGRAKHSRRKIPGPPRRAPSTAPLIAPLIAPPRDDVCVVCGAVQRNKFDSTLMCTRDHATCFTCVAERIQPHPLCGDTCNGFKYKCAGCSDVWLCINRVQELALMCGGHSLGRARLRDASIDPQEFVQPHACESESESESESDSDSDSDSDASGKTHLTSSSDCCTECACGRCGRKDAWAQLPRVHQVDWTTGHEQRARRLARLRASLMGP